LEGGARWRIEIEKAIRKSQYVLIILSPDSVVSEWVEREYLFASNLKKEIIPLYYRPCDLPLYYLNVHYIDIQGTKYKRNFGEILRALDVKPVVQKKPSITEKAKPVPAKPEKKEAIPKPKKERTGRKWDLRKIGILVALVALILVSVYGLPPLLSPSENTPEPTLTLPQEPEQEPTPTETIVIVTESSSTSTVTFTPNTIATPELGIGSSWIRPADGMVMMFVPEGEFTMGSDTGADDEQPVHQVYLDS
jgi:hypothetical protein